MTQPGSVGLLAGQSGDAQGKSAPTRRGTELSMLAFAAGLVTAALMLVEANQDEKLSLRILWYGLATWRCSGSRTRRFASSRRTRTR
jgi:hypothetical protein